MNTEAGSTIAVVSWTPPMARDNSRKPVTLTSNYNPGSSFPTGTTTVTYTATDAYNNQATASFDVIVSGKFQQVFIWQINEMKMNEKKSGYSRLTYNFITIMSHCMLK